jgi:hypothetical protein
MLKHVHDAKRREALDIAYKGRPNELGHVLHDETAPAVRGRHFLQTLLTSAHHVNPGADRAGSASVGDNHVNWVIEIVSGAMQLGTHLDALCHLQIGARGYNG